MSKICSVNGCRNTNIIARDLCIAHYKRWYRHGDTDIKAREAHPIRIIICEGCGKKKEYESKNLCKSCYQKEWSKKRPSRRPQILLRDYGITIEQYNEMFEKQKGLCIICKKKSNKTLHVDHNHKTKEVRGLLCYRCNSAIGYLDDSPERARVLADYIDKTYAINKE